MEIKFWSDDYTSLPDWLGHRYCHFGSNEYGYGNTCRNKAIVRRAYHKKDGIPSSYYLLCNKHFNLLKHMDTDDAALVAIAESLRRIEARKR